MALTAKGPETLLQHAWKLFEDDHQRDLGENSRRAGRTIASASPVSAARSVENGFIS